MNKLERGKRLLQIAYSYWRRKERLNYLPIRLWIELTSSCNLRCIMCPQSEPRSCTQGRGEPTSIEKGFMSFKLFQKIIDEGKDFVYDVNFHHRGESLLHPELPEMIAYARGVGLYTRLHTNGTLLNEEKAQAILESGLDFLSFSFDGFTAETYERIRRKANFETTLNQISNFLKLKDKLGKIKPYTVFETMELAEVKNKPRPCAQGRGKGYEKDKLALKEKLYSLHLNKFVVKSPHNWAGSFELKRDIAKSKRFSACTFPWFALVVFWNGDVSPCPQDFYGHLIMGNLLNNFIAEIWNGSSYISIRKSMREREALKLGPCQNCDILERKTFLSIPTPNLKVFFEEIFFGHQ